VSSIHKVKIHDSYFHNKAFLGPANKLLYGCTIDFTFTRPDLRGLWDCQWIPKSVCYSQSVKLTSSLFCKLARLFTQQDLSLPFILETTGQSGRWQPSDSIQMEMKASGEEWCCLSNTGEKLLGSVAPDWVFWLHLVWGLSTGNLTLNIIHVVRWPNLRLNLIWLQLDEVYVV